MEREVKIIQKEVNEGKTKWREGGKNVLAEGKKVFKGIGKEARLYEGENVRLC